MVKGRSRLIGSRPRGHPTSQPSCHRVADEDDYEVIHTRSIRSQAYGHTVETPRSPQIGTSWTSSSATWGPEDDTSYALEDDDSWVDTAVDMDIFGPEPTVVQVTMPKKRRSKVSRQVNLVWAERHRQNYLDELIQWDGQGDSVQQEGCTDCIARKVHPPSAGEIRCLDCLVPDLTCASCCERRHQRNPFHQVERWMGTHFIRTSLAKLGLTIQLNHQSMYCQNPQICHQSLHILHTNGVHHVNLYYCGCERSQPLATQLLRHGLYPSTHEVPKTVATFALMELLHHLSITSKGSSLDFYKTIERFSNNTGLDIPKSRYAPLRCMTTQWRHLKLLKHGGEGELAVQCPSCPYPGINAPLDLSKIPKELWFLFRVILVMDANFKLKNQLVSSYSRDPGFGIGWAYFVPREKYEKYLLENIHEDEISTCVGFAALAQASTRFSRGLCYTGVSGILCEQSDMLMPNGLVNIPKGKRYASMDFAFAYSLKTFLVIFYLLLSYDIACQWFINLFSQISEVWADHMKLTQSLSLENVIPAVGKFHKPAHLQKDPEQYSFNLIAGVGHSNGEGPECLWAAHNALSYSTKPMAPGTRQDALDAHFAAWNWGKLTNMGHTLMRRYKAAIAKHNIQVEAHNGWTARLPQEFLQAWEASCTAWENTTFPKEAENLFEISNEFIGEEALQELEAEERTRRASGAVAWNDVTVVGFISMGLELEQTCILVQEFVKSKTSEPGSHGHSSHQRREREEHAIAEQRAPLREKLTIYERLQGIYMPGLLQMLMDIQEDVERASELTNPEDACLWLPSSIPSNRRVSVCVPKLVDIENRIQTAQCNDSIQALQHTLRVKSRMVLFKNANIVGQRPGLRS
ncbi:hypothetical protein VKT23_019900 [Stygiomarasmius scandens]|uniref:CxC2-like cysteine cluster KDZ transposase-associated domain-containing protein n=1 Tax=Marasmiellus scandens TaxID=2682957 RepID=A0ABR1IM84_9AGAR